MLCLIRKCKIKVNNSFLNTNMLHPRFNSNGTYSYEAAIDALNTLQSNAQYLRNREVEAANSTHEETKANCIGKMNAFLNRCNIDINKLKSVIHVAGTKGKGSTCAFCESILRTHGFKTGFYSSPHLINVAERIKINSNAIDNEVFAKTFWEVYSDLVKSKDNAISMPIYFQMLTLVAFKLFVEENVDVAIIEVGIGGEYDSTNVIRHSDVVGITSLGLDHTSMLGNTIEKIAWHKGGIMKKGCRAFSMPQCEAAMEVLKSRSKEINCDLEIVEPIKDIPVQNGIPEDIYRNNASLAMKISETWLKTHNHEVNSKKTHDGLVNCRWPGRFQVIRTQNATFYADGAHTAESLQYCSNWYKGYQSNTKNNVINANKPHRVLLFNSTGGRDVETHLQILHECDFHRVYFVPNVCQSTSNTNLDNINHNFPESEQLVKCQMNKRKWCELFPHDASKAHVMPSVNTALEHMMTTNRHHEVLITGSLHLIGSALQALANFNASLTNALRSN